MKIIPSCRSRLVWEYGNGEKIMIGTVNIKGMAGTQILEEHTLNSINKRVIFFLCLVIRGIQHSCHIWKSTSELGLPQEVEQNWREYIDSLSQASLLHILQGDTITWGGKIHNQIPLVAKTYRSLITLRQNLYQCS